MRKVFYRSSILVYLVIVFVVVTGIAIGINWVVVYENMAGVYFKVATDIESGIGVMISDQIEEYESIEWLVSYWENNADLLSFPKQDDPEQTKAWHEAHAVFDMVAVEAVPVENIEAMSEEEQKLFAEYCYVRLMDRFLNYRSIISVSDIAVCRIDDDGKAVELFSAKETDPASGVYGIDTHPHIGKWEESYQTLKAMPGEADTQFTTDNDKEGEEKWIALTPVYHDGKMLCVFRVTARTADMVQQLNSSVVRIESMVLAVMAISGVITMILVLKIIVRPMRRMQTQIRHYATSKELDELLEELGEYQGKRSEIATLGKEIGDMASEVERYYNEVIELTAEKERLETRLAMAADIKAHLMPNVYPAFSEVPSFDVYADQFTMTGVGGDFYDYYRVDEDHIVTVIADIYDGGTESALYMIVFKVMLQSIVMMGLPIEDVMRILNNRLCSRNEDNLCLSAWVGIYEISTGRMTAVNAGSEAPIMIPASGEPEQGAYVLTEDMVNYPMGIIDSMDYFSYTFEIPEGWGLFLYTDGLLDPCDGEEEFRDGEIADRLTDAVKGTEKGKPLSIRDMIGSIQNMFFEKVGDSPLAQDVTMVCLMHCAGEQRSEEANVR